MIDRHDYRSPFLDPSAWIPDGYDLAAYDHDDAARIDWADYAHQVVDRIMVTAWEGAWNHANGTPAAHTLHQCAAMQAVARHLGRWADVLAHVYGGGDVRELDREADR